MQYGKGRHLVFLHGWGGSTDSFRALADRLSGEYTVTLLDMYGFGATPHPDHPLTLSDYARGVKDLLLTLGVEDAVLIGHSFGGRVAMRLAAEESFVSALVLIDSAGIPPRRGLKWLFRVLLYKIGKTFGHPPKRAGSADYAALRGAMRKTFVNVVNTSSVPDAKRVLVPTLLFWGSEDRDTPFYMCKRLKRLIRNSEIVEARGMGHFSYLERPEFAYRVIRAFCEAV